MKPGGKIDLRSILQVALRRKWYLIIPAIVAILGAYYRITTMEPVFKSSTTIVIDQDRELLKDMDALLPEGNSKKVQKMKDMGEDIVKQLLAKTTLGAVIDSVGLKPSSSMREEVRKMKLEHPDADEAALLRGLQIEWLEGRLFENIILPKRGNYVEISFIHRDPEIAYRVVKTLADVFIENAKKIETEEVEPSQEFSEDKKLEFQEKYEEARGRLESYKVQLAREGSRNFLVNATNIDAINSQINSLKVDISRQQQHVQELAGRVSEASSPLNVAESVIGADLRRKMQEKAGRLATLMVRFTWKDSEVIKVNQDLAVLREQYRAELAAAAGALDGDGETVLQHQMAVLDLDLLNLQRSSLEGFIAEYQRSLTFAPAKQSQLEVLEKEVAQLEVLLNAFQGQARGLSLKKELRQKDAQARYRILDPANRPAKPMTDDQNKIMLIAVFGGLGFGIGAVYLLEFFDHSFKSVEDVEAYLGVTVLGTIPRIQAAGGLAKPKRPLAVSLLAVSVVAVMVLAFVLMRQFQ
ncbi:MAG: GumC family protein [bacterium]